MPVLAGNKNRSRANRGQVLDQQLESLDLTIEPTSCRKLEYREPGRQTRARLDPGVIWLASVEDSCLI